MFTTETRITITIFIAKNSLIMWIIIVFLRFGRIESWRIERSGAIMHKRSSKSVKVHPPIIKIVFSRIRDASTGTHVLSHCLFTEIFRSSLATHKKKSESSSNPQLKFIFLLQLNSLMIYYIYYIYANHENFQWKPMAQRMGHVSNCIEWCCPSLFWWPFSDHKYAIIVRRQNPNLIGECGIKR